MSRNIPPVRRWRVRFYMGHTLLADLIVDAINKRFARATACQRVAHEQWQRYVATDKVTCSPMVRPS